MKKRIVSFLMALVMAVSLLPVSAFAVEDAASSDVPAIVEQEPLEDEESAKDEAPVEDVGPAQEAPAPVDEPQQGEGINTPVVQAASGDYVITLSKLTPSGTIQYTSDASYPVYYVQIDGNSYKSMSVTPNEKITVDGKRKTFPSILFACDTDDKTKSILTSVSVPYDSENKYFQLGASYYDNYKDKITLSEEIPEGSSSLLWRMPYGIGTKKNPYITHAFLLVTWTGDSGEVNKDALNAAIKSAPDTTSDTVYYHENDKFNGKTSSANGFWKDMCTALNTAVSVTNDKYVSEDAVKAATDNLTAAIANLIPADRANTTLLYEALQSTPVSNDGAYSTKSWAAYQTVRDKAEALMATMFHEDGSANLTNNKAEKQAAIETLAAELKAASKKLDAKGGSGTQAIAKLELEAIQYLTKKYDPNKLSGYTPESMAALRDARTAALKLAAETTVSDVGSNESQALVEALCELRKAIYGLTTTSTAQITVKVSVLDTNDVYRGRGTDADRNKNIYTGTLTLDANASAYETLNSRGLLAGSRDTATAEAVVFLNGELVHGNLTATGSGCYHDMGQPGGAFQAIKLHNGDELTVVWIYAKQILNSSQVGTYPAYLVDIPDWFRYSTVSAPVEVTAGPSPCP